MEARSPVTEEGPSLDDIVLKYRQLRDAIEVITNEAAEKCRVMKEAMTTIENYLAAYMANTKLESLPTTNGTAYKSTVTSVKMLDKEAFFNYALKNNVALLEYKCNKTALKDYEEVRNKKGEITKPGKPYPPGVEVTKLSRVNIRGK